MDLIVMLLLVTAQAVPAQPAAAAPIQDKVMCRMIQSPESRIPDRVCRLQSEWAQMEKDTQDELQSSRHQRTSKGLDPSNPGSAPH